MEFRHDLDLEPRNNLSCLKPLQSRDVHLDLCSYINKLNPSETCKLLLNEKFCYRSFYSNVELMWLKMFYFTFYSVSNTFLFH